MARRMVVSPLVKAVAADLRALKSTSTSEGQLALSLARWLDDPGTKDTARASMAGRLAEIMAGLREGAPAGVESPLERIRRERDAGVARLADAEGRARSRRKRAS